MSLYKIRSLLKLNLKFMLDYEFLRDGRYTNINVGQTYYDTSDMSVLLCDTSADNTLFGINDGQVWQSAFRNWVYESGIALNDAIEIRTKPLPFVCSGVYVSGVFRATDTSHPDYDSTASHHIDWINGRVIFNNKIPLDATVQATFAYKHVFIGFEHHYNNQYNQGYLEEKYVTNPLTSNALVYPSGTMIPFPAVFIENFSRRFSAYELGNRSLIVHDRMIFHIWSADDMTRDDIADTISFQEAKTLPLIDFNLAPIPLSGIYNELSPDYLPFQELLKNPRITVPGSISGTSNTIGYMCDFNETRIYNDTPYVEFERARVETVVRVYLIAPSTPIGLNTGAYQFRGGTEYF